MRILHRPMKKITISSYLFVVMVFASCSFDYREAMVEESLSEELPTSILIDISQTIVESGHTVLEVQAARAEIYDESNKTVVQDLLFTEFGKDGQNLTEGKAEKVIYFRDTENAEFSGSVWLYSAPEETSVTTENMTWDNENRRLTTPADSFVAITRNDGSVLEGRGMEADLRLRRIILQTDVKGIYITDENE